MAVGYALVGVGALAGIRLLTEILQPAEYGQLALGMTIATLINQAVLGPLCQGALRFYSIAMERKAFGGYAAALGRLAGSAIGVLAAVAAVAALLLFANGMPGWVGLTTAAVMFAVISGYVAILTSIMTAARRRASAAVYQGAETWLRFLLAAALVLLLGGGSITALFGYALASLAILTAQYLFFWRKLPKEAAPDAASVRDWRRQIWTYSWPIAAFGIFTWAQSISDRWALQSYVGTHEVGLYAAVFQLGYYPVVTLAGMAQQFVAPILFQRAGSAEDAGRSAEVVRLTWHLMSVALAFTALAFVAAYVFSAEIFRLVVAADYAAVSPLLPWVVLGGGLMTAAQGLALGLMSQIRTYDMMPAKIGTALFGIACNFAGAYWFGVAGVVAAGVLFALSYLVWMAFLVGRT